MNKLKYNIKVEKTARFYTCGELSDKTKTIWLVVHGYGQLANNFLDDFRILARSENFIVAPEALHRFYQRVTSGEVGGSWMTKEDRVNEIIDNNNYLDKIYNKYYDENKSIKVLGFSQGCATVCRWMIDKKPKVDNLFLWGGSVPEDINLIDNKKLFEESKIKLIAGKRDRIVKEEYLDDEIKRFNKFGIKCSLVKYAGEHEIDENVLMFL